MNRRNNRPGGFTLIEVMVVVTIVGILAAIAYPSYQDIVRQTRRADALSAVMDMMAKQERYFTDFNIYVKDADLAKLGFTVTSDKVATTGDYYLISAAACGAGIGSCVELTAVGQNGQEKDGGGTGTCKTLTLNSQGGKGPTACWKK